MSSEREQFHQQVIVGDHNKKAVFVLIGASGSGKSTFTKLVPNGCIFSLDQLRLDWYTGGAAIGPANLNWKDQYKIAYEKSVEDKQFASKANAAFTALVKVNKDQRDIIIDNTNLSARRRRFYVDMARQTGFKVIAVVFPIALDQLKQRNKSRTDKLLPEEAIVKQYMSLQQPLQGEFDSILYCTGNLE